MSARRAPVVPLTAALVLLGCAGCGASTHVGSDGALQVALTEYRVIPQDVHAEPGLLAITVRNDGRLTHDLVLTHDGVVQAATKPIAPGQTATLDVDLSAGRYLLSSSILSDQALGAYGTLDVGS